MARPAQAGIDGDEDECDPEDGGCCERDSRGGDAPKPVLHDERTQPGEHHQHAAAVGAGATPAQGDEREDADDGKPAPRGRGRGQHRCQQESLHLVGDTEEANTAVRVRPDRGQRIRLREGREDDEEDGEEERDDRCEERFPASGHEGGRSTPGRNGDADRERRADAGGGEQ